MKIPPKKPHFFKPIVPGFKQGLKVPIGFLKYLKGLEHGHGVLRRNGKKWQVKLNGHRFEAGWAEFAEEHDLHLGNILVFRHEGDMEFDVSIFDSSHIDREYAEHLEEEEELEDLRGNASLQPEGKKINLDTTRVSTQEKSKPSITSSPNAFSNVEAANDMPLGRPHFITTIRPHCMSKLLLHVPKLVAQENGLSNRKCTVMIRDEERSWEFKLRSFKLGSTFIGGDWRKFCAANFLKEGDRIMFEIFAEGEKPTLKFYDLRGNASLQPKGKKTNLDTKRDSNRDLRGNASLQPEGKKANLDAAVSSTQGLKIETSDMSAPKAQVPASTPPNANPHFVSTIQPYAISPSCLYLPTAFAKSNGLVNRRCEMILIDEQRRSWSVRLRPMSHKVGINRGWCYFRKANDVQVGDTYKFELINNKAVPVAYFHCKYAGKDAPGIREALDKVMKQLLMGNGKEH